MLSSYFKIALRYFRRNKLYTAINILGLSIGTAACLVIFLIVNYENSFDKFWEDKDQIYRVYSKFSGAFEATNRGVPTAMGPWVRENLGDATMVAPFHSWSAPVIIESADGNRKELERQKGVILVDPAYFDIFANYKWLAGTPAIALKEPQQVVLTPEKVKLYFDLDQAEQAIGRTLIYNDTLLMTVSGVVERPTGHSDFYFQDFISLATVEHTNMKSRIPINDWGSTNSSSQLFIKLGKEVNPALFEEKLLGAKEAYVTQNEDVGYIADYKLQPLNDIHFNSDTRIFDGSRTPAHRRTLSLLSLVAILLLLIAAINFINLETAQSLKRAQEVGVRKVLGGTRRELIMQFLSATLLLTLVAMVLAATLTQWALGFYEDFIPAGLTFQLFSASTLLILGSLTLLVCLVAGLYPAFVLSSFRPIKALKNQVFSSGGSGGNISLRRGLVVFQFVIAQVLIFGTLTIGRQISYMMNIDMGFEKEAITYFYTPWQDTTDRGAVLVQELQRLPGITAISSHSSPPAERGYSTNIVKYNKEGEELQHNVHRKSGDTAFINLYEIELLAGRNLLPSDTVKELMINETYLHQLGFEQPNEALGEVLTLGDKFLPIVGVVADFHIQPLRVSIQPTMIGGEVGNTISLKLQDTENGPEAFTKILAQVETKYKELYPDEQFEAYFMDEEITQFYEREEQTAQLVKTATTMAILICCLGLFGLISFTTTQRTKEIGIRKILGASILHLISILTRNFLFLVLIALLIASPLAYWLSKQWLQDFAYAIPIQWWQFVVVGLLGIGITLLTVSFHSFRAATANPVESLRQD